jgi:hypothetical protein
MEATDLIFETGIERPNGKPDTARERFTPSLKSKEFLNECREKGYDISTIINLALETFQPKTKSNYFTWDGIENVARGKKKWF